MSGSVSPFDGEVVADTVVVNYFLAVGRFPLLAAIAGGRVYVPRAVYDPEDAQRVPEVGLSELEQGLRRHRRRAADEELSPRQRELSREALPHFEQLPDHTREGSLVPLILDPVELSRYSAFRDPMWTRQFDLIAGLGAGEAAAMALAETRNMRLATDDQDCIRVVERGSSGITVLRVRRLLQTAVDVGLLGREEARSVHLAMVSAGFRDKGRL